MNMVERWQMSQNCRAPYSWHALRLVAAFKAKIHSCRVPLSLKSELVCQKAAYQSVEVQFSTKRSLLIYWSGLGFEISISKNYQFEVSEWQTAIRSIAILMKTRKRLAQSCEFYDRFGTCFRQKRLKMLNNKRANGFGIREAKSIARNRSCQQAFQQNTNLVQK